jgi:hypothetical protein
LRRREDCEDTGNVGGCPPLTVAEFRWCHRYTFLPLLIGARFNLIDTLYAGGGGPETPLRVLFFGSSLGNFRRGEEVAFVRALSLRAGKGDTLLVAIDHFTDGARIERACIDQAGIECHFILIGLKCPESAGR